MAKYIDAEKLRISMIDAFCMFDIPFDDTTAKVVFKVIDRAQVVVVKGGTEYRKYQMNPQTGGCV